MSKYKVAIFLREIPFQAEASDMRDVMDRLDALCEVIRQPLDASARLDIYEKLSSMEHAGKDSSLSVADRPISISFTSSPVGFMVGPCGVTR